MKKLIITLSLIFLLGCNSSRNSSIDDLINKGDLETLRKKKKEYVDIMNDLRLDLNQINNGITLLDENEQIQVISKFNVIEKEFKIKLNFEQIESILVGNLLYKISESDKILREGNIYKIIQQNQSIQTQNIVSIKTSKIEKLILFDEFTNYLLTVDYDDFKPLGKLLFPVKHSYTSISYTDNTSVPVITNIIFKYNKVSRTNKALKFPFKIPSKYVVEKI